MKQKELLSGLILELRRGTIVLSVLSQLRSPMYGYSLVTRLAEHQIPVEPNTLYPLLRRLEGQGLLSSEWETSGNKPRKYYVLTPLGQEILQSLSSHWHNSVKSMSALLAAKPGEPPAYTKEEEQ